MQLFIMTLVTLSLVVVYYQRVPVARAPLGHFNWRDLVLAMAIIVLMPLLYINAPVIIPTIIFGAVWLALLTTALSPLLPRASLIAVILVIAQVWLCLPLITNIATLIMAVGVGTMFIRNGLRSWELALFACALLVYDLVATSMLGQMMELMEVLLSQPFFIGFVVGDMFLGGGDVLVLSIFTADITRHGGNMGYVAAGALTVPMALLYFFGDWITVGIPYMVIAVPIYLLMLSIALTGKLHGRRHLS